MISSDLQAFIRSCVRSVWALDLLVLLQQETDRVWTADDLVQEMRSSTAVVADALADFDTAGLVRAGGPDAWVYAPATPALTELAERLASAYRERPARVVKAIMAAPNDKLQNVDGD